MQAENTTTLSKNSSDSETGLQDIQEEPRRHIGPSHVRELAKLFSLSSDEEKQSHGQDTRDFSTLKRRREGVMKRNKHCNLTFKPKLGPLRTVLCFPEASLLYFYQCNL